MRRRELCWAALATLAALLQARRGHGAEEDQQRIVGGEIVQDHEWEWMASLQIASGGDYFHYCGGSLVHPRLVLTAAHCLQRSVPDRVVFMQLDLGGRPEAGAVIAGVQRVFRAPGYSIIHNDAALIELDQDVDLDVIELYKGGPLESAGQMLTVAGWGKLYESADSGTDELRAVDLPVVSYDTCKESYPALEQNCVCAGYKRGGKDSCSGDSGGPLFHVDEDGNAVQVGIVSYGDGCARPELYGVYAQVSAHRAWIMDVYTELGLSDDLSASPLPTSQPTESPTPDPDNGSQSNTVNPNNCYIFKGNPGYFKEQADCQLPFYFAPKKGKPRIFYYPPTIKEMEPWGVRRTDAKRNDDVTRWCPPKGTEVYDITKGSALPWGVVLCDSLRGFPTARPTPAPTPHTARPTKAPTTRRPTASPTNRPTRSPTAFPTDSPTRSPTMRPTYSPSPSPTVAPTDSPTAFPTKLPSKSPTPKPTPGPTNRPTIGPTDFPTLAPSSAPSKSPTTSQPTASPSTRPTPSPTLFPTTSPTLSPTTSIPSASPTQSPTTKEFGTRDQFCKSLSLEECKSDNFRGGQCEIRDEGCRGKPRTASPTLSPTQSRSSSPTTSAPTQSPTAAKKRPEETTGQASRSGGTSTLAVASATGGFGVLALVVAIGSVIFVRRKRRQSKQGHANYHTGGGPTGANFGHNLTAYAGQPAYGDQNNVFGYDGASGYGGKGTGYDAEYGYHEGGPVPPPPGLARGQYR